jgi:hypothetical protein
MYKEMSKTERASPKGRKKGSANLTKVWLLKALIYILQEQSLAAIKLWDEHNVNFSQAWGSREFVEINILPKKFEAHVRSK